MRSPGQDIGQALAIIITYSTRCIMSQVYFPHYPLQIHESGNDCRLGFLCVVMSTSRLGCGVLGLLSDLHLYKIHSSALLGKPRGRDSSDPGLPRIPCKGMGLMNNTLQFVVTLEQHSTWVVILAC